MNLLLIFMIPFGLLGLNFQAFEPGELSKVLLNKKYSVFESTFFEKDVKRYFIDVTNICNSYSDTENTNPFLSKYYSLRFAPINTIFRPETWDKDVEKVVRMKELLTFDQLEINRTYQLYFEGEGALLRLIEYKEEKDYTWRAAGYELRTHAKLHDFLGDETFPVRNCFVSIESRKVAIVFDGPQEGFGPHPLKSMDLISKQDINEYKLTSMEIIFIMIRISKLVKKVHDFGWAINKISLPNFLCEWNFEKNVCGKIKLFDLGQAQEKVVMPFFGIGVEDYRAPELESSSAKFVIDGFKSDVYALGIAFSRLLDYSEVFASKGNMIKSDESIINSHRFLIEKIKRSFRKARFEPKIEQIGNKTKEIWTGLPELIFSMISFDARHRPTIDEVIAKLKVFCRLSESESYVGMLDIRFKKVLMSQPYQQQGD